MVGILRSKTLRQSFMMKKALNLGCQIHHFDSQPDMEWVNQDVVGDDPNIKAELVCDAADLSSIPDNTFDFIYSGHLVEHFYPDTLGAAIQEWRRVLKPGGRLVIVTPDCGAVMKDYASGRLQHILQTWQQLYGRIYSYDRPEERHHIAFDEKTLIMLTSADSRESWQAWSIVSLRFPPAELEPFMDTHISRGAYQLGIILTKAGDSSIA
jgi:predicted SAM-dependent methyltransferase